MWSNFDHFDVIGPESYRFDRNNAKYWPLRVRGHSRSPLSAYYSNLHYIVTYILSRTVYKISGIIGPIFEVERGCLTHSFGTNSKICEKNRPAMTYNVFGRTLKLTQLQPTFRIAKFGVKIRNSPLSCGVKYIAITWTVYASITSVTDRWTDGRTNGQSSHA